MGFPRDKELPALANLHESARSAKRDASFEFRHHPSTILLRIDYKVAFVIRSRMCTYANS